MVADVTVVGAGIVALTTALALADRGAAVRLVGTTHRGEASEAAGGLLTPSVEPELQVISALATAARDFYPDFLALLESRTGISVWLNRLGVLQIARSEDEAHSLRQRSGGEGAEWLDHRALSALEPALAGPECLGALYTPLDGCVDPLLVLDALRSAVAVNSNISVASENICYVKVSKSECLAASDREGHYGSQSIVLAAGAWTPQIEGVPMPLPIEPVKGQMMAFEATPTRHVAFGAGCYLIPKADGRTVAGSTLERVGFTPDVTEEGIATVRAMAETACPALGQASVHATWAGLRPMTPDLLPILGPDPEEPRVVYACGHSRNGILLAPLTAACVADFAMGRTPEHDVAQLRPGRFLR
jgi:glycine oxidase